MTLGECIQAQREEMNLTRIDLAVKSGVSSTEIQRIETGARTNPSLKNVCAIADALSIPQEILLNLAGYSTRDTVPSIKHTFPGLRSRRQQFAIERAADILSKNSDLKDTDLDEICAQIEMYTDYTLKKKLENR